MAPAQRNESVTVRFDPDTQQFDIQPETVTLGGPGRIQIRKQPSNATWGFDHIAIQDSNGQFAVESTSPQVIIVRDDFLVPGDFCYTVTVKDAQGSDHVSPDPHIRNENPGTM